MIHKKLNWLRSKFIVLLFMLFATLGIQAQVSGLSALFQAGNPAYLGNYAQNKRLNITLNGTLKGQIIYKDERLVMDSLHVHNNIIEDRITKKEYNLHNPNLTQITLINADQIELRLFRIYPYSKTLFREIEQVDELTFYDNYITFDNTTIDRYNIVIGYNDLFYELPKNKKKRQRMINHTFADPQIKATIVSWAIAHM